MSVAAADDDTDGNNSGSETGGDETNSGENTVTASVTYTASEDGKTLTISGKGDLTNYKTTDYSAKVFSEKAVGQVYVDQWGGGNSFVSITEGSSYSVSNKYYEPQFTQIFTDGAPTNGNYVYNVSTTDGKTTYTVGNNYKVFVSTDNGSTKTALTAGSTYTYTAGEMFYTASSYTLISDNATYFTEHSDYLTADQTEISVAELTRRKIANGTYTTVKFENTGTDALLIDNDIVQAVLYKYANSSYTYNEDMTTLDLGAATVKNFTSSTFDYPTGVQWISGNRTLTTLTLPLVQADASGNVTVPSQILAGSSSYYSHIQSLTIPEGYTAIGDHAFGGDGNSGYKQLSVLTNVKFPSSLTTVGDNAFQACGKLQSVELNEGLKTIGKYAFWGSDLRSITFPSSLDKIDNAAFMDLKYLTSLKFNEGLRYIGTSAFAWANNGDPNNTNAKLVLTTLEIPASVKYIGPAAFKWHEYQDVYFLGEDAPVMPMGTDVSNNENQVAFDYQVYMINNGMNVAAQEGTLREDCSTGWANRVNYQGTGGQYLCIIHYPNGLSTEKANKYQDQTRVYLTETPYNKNDQYAPNESEPEKNNENMTIYGQIGLNSGTKVNYGYKDTYLGEQYIWPNITQVERAYIYASNGYNWDGTTVYAPELTNDEKAVLIEAGFLTESSSDEDVKAAQKYAHLGTRMFVLAMNDAKKDTDPDVDPDYPVNIQSGGKWWTLVVPFNMTKKMVDDTFGDGTNPTHVCRFNKVDRITNGSNTHVKLYFTDDVYAHKAVKENDTYGTTTTEVTGEDDIVIYAHEAYMIYPTKKIDYTNGERFTVKDYTLEAGSPMPTLVKANAHNTSYTGKDNTEYRFIGNYIGESASSKIDTQDEDVATQSSAIAYVPQYSYMYAKKKSDTNHKFWFWYGATANGVVWNPNTCVVQATAKDGGVKDYTDVFGGTTAGASDNAKQLCIFGDEDNTTAIEQVEIIIGNNENASVVYNLNGQPVSNGSTAGLAKGVYIQNGKKFVVK